MRWHLVIWLAGLFAGVIATGAFGIEYDRADIESNVGYRVQRVETITIAQTRIVKTGPNAESPVFELILAHQYYEGIGGPKNLDGVTQILRIMIFSYSSAEILRNRELAVKKEWSADFVKLIDEAVSWFDRVNAEAPDYAYRLSKRYRAKDNTGHEGFLADILLGHAGLREHREASFDIAIRQLNDPRPSIHQAARRVIWLLANNGFTPAQRQLTARYAHGDGFERDPAKAYYWWRRSNTEEASGNQPSKELENLISDADRSRASDWLARGITPEP